MSAETERDPVVADRIEPERIEPERIEPERIEVDAAGWDDRQLCPDGACIGVIGADGRCTVCGTADPTWSADRPRAAPTAPAAIEAATLPAETTPVGEAPEWDDRQLCPDGACIGVIGPGGRCTVCAAPAPAST